MLLGVWADDMAKCGVYEQAGVNPKLDGVVPVTSELPVIDIIHPGRVVSDGLNEIKKLRAAFRAKTAAVESLFSVEELNQLSKAYEGALTEGTMSLLDLRAAFSLLGREVEEGALLSALSELTVEVCDGHLTNITLQSFLRTLALIKSN